VVHPSRIQALLEGPFKLSSPVCDHLLGERLRHCRWLFVLPRHQHHRLAEMPHHHQHVLIAPPGLGQGSCKVQPPHVEQPLVGQRLEGGVPGLARRLHPVARLAPLQRPCPVCGLPHPPIVKAHQGRSFFTPRCPALSCTSFTRILHATGRGTTRASPLTSFRVLTTWSSLYS
jgi:hypothetical protein